MPLAVIVVEAWWATGHIAAVGVVVAVPVEVEVVVGQVIQERPAAGFEVSELAAVAEHIDRMLGGRMMHAKAGGWSQLLVGVHLHIDLVA